MLRRLMVAGLVLALMIATLPAAMAEERELQVNNALIATYLSLVLMVEMANAEGISNYIGLRCVPSDNTARILNSSNPNDLHQDWRGESYIGMAWTLVVSGVAQEGRVLYLKGNLYSPRGGLINPLVYVIAKEWSCR
jgi:hypothetical protein